MTDPDELCSIIILDVSEHNLPEDGYLVPLLRLWYRGCFQGMVDFFNISAKLNPLPELGAGERNLARLPG